MFLRLFSSLILLFYCLQGYGLTAESSFSGNTNPAFGAQQEKFLTVEQAYQAELLFTQGQWLVIWQLADNHYLYRHGFKNEWLNNGKTEAIESLIPEGIKQVDEYFGEVETYYRQVAIPLTKNTADTLYLKATSQGCADAGLCYPPYSVYFKIDNIEHRSESISAEAYKAALTQTSSGQTTGTVSLAWILFSALLGGLILNLMPCVLPVLSIKIMQLARHPNSVQARKESLVYMAGVIISFVAIAGIMLALRATGSAVGWGFQLQNPWVIVGLVYLFFILGLSMSGAIHLGHRWMGMGQSLTDKGGISGAFFTGVLAVIVASPCTAPFMSAALGYAISQPTLVALLIFAVLGLGMALPLTLASFIPAAGKLLPKPGLWMEQLKQFFAFPLYATAIWLLWVFGNQTSTLGMMTLLFGCLSIFIAFWYFRNTTITSRFIGCLALIAAIALPVSMNFSKQEKLPETGHVVFSQERLAALRQQNQPVFIDLTADWCITCIANEKSTLETAAVQQAFKDAGIVYMVGDWTDYNPEINRLLADYGRSGIPLYLLFSANPDMPALILPQLLTPAIVLEYIGKIDSEH